MMLRFVLQKMISKKWMVLALLIGNILLVSITCANAMYGDAMLQRTLTRRLHDYLQTENKYPGTITVETGSSISRNPLVLQAADVIQTIPDAYGIPSQTVTHYYIGSSTMKNGLDDAESTGRLVSLGSLNALQEHIEIVAGRMYQTEPDENGIIDVMVSERGMVSMELILDEILSFPKINNAQGKTLQVRVCGVFRSATQDDAYWVRSPDAYRSELLMAQNLFEQLFIHGQNEAKLNGQFYVLLDYTAMRGDQVDEMLSLSAYYKECFEQVPGQSYTDSFSDILQEFQATKQKVEVTLWVLQVPVFVLLATFIFMVSQQMLDMERNEIAVLKSRGASKRQILLTYFMQSSMLALISILVGVPLGILLVQILGSANAFLEFVQRSALPVRLQGKVFLFAGAATLLSMMAMVLPVFRFANVTIVNHKQKKHRKSQTPLWQKLFLDVVVLAVALYALYSYNGQKDALAQKVLDGEALDPLLYISSSLFLIGAGLLALRVLPMITFLVFHGFKKWWRPSVYAGFLQVIRTRKNQNFIMVFLVVTIALGVFNAQAARTINSNKEDNVRYSAGADIVLRETWADNSAQVRENPSLKLVYEEPDFARFANLEGVASATKVLNLQNASMRVKGGTLKNLQVMGIHTKEFGETAWFKDGLLSHHFYEYLNAMSMHSGAVLLSRNFQTNYGYKLGDMISYENVHGDTARGFVYGFVDYWPGFEPVVYTKGTDGIYQQTEKYLIVANLSQLQSDWGIMPYEVWLKAEGSTQFIYDYAQEQGIYFKSFADATAQMVSLKNDPIFQGTNGILTVGFIVALLLCCVGFLIYWILSIRSRQLQFGIYRAMGMSMKEIISMLLCEQAFISGTSVAAGVLVGYLTSKLYMPLIQMAYAAYDNALPMELISKTSDITRLLSIAIGVILVCMVILGWLISKMKIAQALKLGED